MAPARFISLILATIYLTLHAKAQVPVPGQSLTFNTAIPTGPVGGCLTASSNADGAPVIIQDCPVFDAPTASNTWVAAAGVGKPGALKIFGDKCLDATNGVDENGTKLQIWTCAPGNTNQEWVSAGSDPGTPQIVWAGNNKCVDVTNGNVTNGNVLQIWDCDASFDNSNQNWGIALTTQPKSVSLSLASFPSLCIASSANAPSAPVTIEPCSASPTQTWLGSGVGPLASAQNSTLCLAPSGDALGAGTRLVLSACSQSDPASAWDLDWQAGRIENVAAEDMCVDLTDGNQTPGTQLQIWNCTAGNTNQDWVASFNF
ncbi:ricin B lectin domain-containing protein [Mycena haematopus]|nr:ricin B lectin domain-containing protein [Mycena haematopus]